MTLLGLRPYNATKVGTSVLVLSTYSIKQGNIHAHEGDPIIDASLYVLKDLNPSLSRRKKNPKNGT
jgi:hypothetical protein